MGRILAIDYGLKRTGLAVTDESQVIAFALTTVPTAELPAFLKQYQSENEIDAFVVGIPRKMNNQFSEIITHVEGFIKRLRRDFPGKEIYRVDERFTSSMASKSIRDSGVKKEKRRDKTLIDQVSATIILQSWLLQKELGR